MSNDRSAGRADGLMSPLRADSPPLGSSANNAAGVSDWRFFLLSLLSFARSLVLSTSLRRRLPCLRPYQTAAAAAARLATSRLRPASKRRQVVRDAARTATSLLTSRLSAAKPDQLPEPFFDGSCDLSPYDWFHGQVSVSTFSFFAFGFFVFLFVEMRR